jgi:hypothetical protein
MNLYRCEPVLDRYTLPLFIKYFSKIYPDSINACPSVFSALASHSKDLSSGCVKDLLKRAWLASNKSSSFAWLQYQSSLQPISIQRHNGCFSEEHCAAVNSLNWKGYYIFQRKLPRHLLDGLIDLCHACPLSPELPGQQVSSSTPFSRDQAINNFSYSRFFYPAQVIRSRLVKSLAKEPSLLSIVSEYLWTSRMSIKATGWLSVGRFDLTLNQLSSNAQLFHIDLDAFRFLKVFVYLSDVALDDGPHVYVSGSSLPYRDHAKVLSKLDSSLRISDSDILNLYGQSSLKTHTGDAGTVIIEDTSGFHKGTPLGNGASRDIISLVYEAGPFNLG